MSVIAQIEENTKKIIHLDNKERVYYVYLITDEEGYFKIGVTCNIENRLAGLQIGNGRILRVVCITKRSYRQEVYGWEARLHMKFRESRASGEWFKLNVEEFDNVVLSFRELGSKVSSEYCKAIKEKLDDISMWSSIKINPFFRQFWRWHNDPLTYSQINEQDKLSSETV